MYQLKQVSGCLQDGQGKTYPSPSDWLLKLLSKMNTIRFITYSKRKLSYELVDLLGALCFLSMVVLAIGQQFKNEFIERNLSFFVTLMIVGVIWFLGRMFIGNSTWYQPYKETGELMFTEKFLVLKGKQIDIEEIRKLRIEATQCKGLPAGGRSGISDGTGNYIEIYLKNNSKLREKIIIEQVRQRNSLKLLMEDWKNEGIEVIGVWKPFLSIFQN